MKVTWVDLPAPGTGSANRGKKRSPYWAVFDLLDDRPGQWALVIEEHPSPSNPIYGLIKTHNLPYEVKVRKTDKGGYDVYVRLPEKETVEKE
jgi:hypothetical protein